MDYDYIEMLVLQAKNQDYNAKEKLVELINNNEEEFNAIFNALNIK